MPSRLQVLDIWGDLACFSNPAGGKVERFSYPCLTPSAARGILDAIYVKPNRNIRDAEFGWRVRRIEVLKPLQYIALRRNEVKDVISTSAVEKWMRGTSEPEPIWADGDRGLLGTDEKGRTQRQTMALRDVRYRIHAGIRPWLGHEHNLSAFEAQFRRRAAAGKCTAQPYLGCREFPAFFALVEDPNAGPPAINWTQDLGWMVYDVFDLSKPQTAYSPPSLSVFRAVVRNGVLEIPEYESQDVRKAVKEVA